MSDDLGPLAKWDKVEEHVDFVYKERDNEEHR